MTTPTQRGSAPHAYTPSSGVLPDTTPRERRVQWVISTFAAVIGLLGLALAFLRVSTTPIRGSIQATDVSFRIVDRRALDAFEPVQSVTVGSVPVYESGGIPRLPVAAVPSQPVNVELKANDRGALRLKTLELPAHSSLALRYDGRPRQFTLRFPCESRCDTVYATFEAEGNASIFVSGQQPRQPSARTTGTVRVALLPGQSTMTLRWAAGMSLPIVDQARIEELAFEREPLASPPLGQGVSPVADVASSVVGGEVVYEALAERLLSLRRGQHVHLGIARGELESLAVDTASARVVFRATARELWSGAIDDRRQLMPSWLDYLTVNVDIKQLLSFAIGAVSLAFAIVRFYVKPL